jgi:hypothetical protein
MSYCLTSVGKRWECFIKCLWIFGRKYFIIFAFREANFISSIKANVSRCGRQGTTWAYGPNLFFGGGGAQYKFARPLCLHSAHIQLCTYAISCILSIQICSKIYITNFIIFAISHHHSYTGVLYMWQGILKAINIGISIYLIIHCRPRFFLSTLPDHKFFFLGGGDHLSKHWNREYFRNNVSYVWPRL